MSKREHAEKDAAYELIDGDPEFVSVVRRGANRRGWKILKHDAADAVLGGGDEEPRKGLVRRLTDSISVLVDAYLGVAPDDPFAARLKAARDGSDGAPASDAEARRLVTIKGRAVQSVVFDKAEWTERTAKAWLAEHDFETPEVDETENTLRFRQFDPEACEGEYSTLTEDLPAGVSLVTCEVADEVTRAQQAYEDRQANGMGERRRRRRKGFGEFGSSALTLRDALADVTLLNGSAGLFDAFGLLQGVIFNILNSADVDDKKAAVREQLAAFAEVVGTMVEALPLEASTSASDITRAQAGLALCDVPDAALPALLPHLHGLAASEPREEDDMTKEQEQKLDSVATSLTKLTEVLTPIATALNKPKDDKDPTAAAAPTATETPEPPAPPPAPEPTPPTPEESKAASDLDAKVSALTKQVSGLTEKVEELLAGVDGAIKESVTENVEKLATRVRKLETQPFSSRSLGRTSTPEENGTRGRGRFDSVFPGDFHMRAG